MSRKNKTQTMMYQDTCEDLPLFSMTAQTVTVDTYIAHEVGGQDSLFAPACGCCLDTGKVDNHPCMCVAGDKYRATDKPDDFEFSNFRQGPVHEGDIFENMPVSELEEQTTAKYPSKGDISRMSIVAMLTGSTCGEACWCATEDVCRCSCGGKNHGIFRRGGDRPKRTAKIDGAMYELAAVGNREVYADAEKINKSVGPSQVCKIDDTLTYTYYWKETDNGAPARVKPASRAQCEKWQELTAWKGQTGSERYFNTPYLLWVKVAA